MDVTATAARDRLLALLAEDDLDAALQAGLMELGLDPADPGNAPLLQARLRLQQAWQARERHRARQQRLARIAAEREARRRAAAPVPGPAAGSSSPALPPAAAAALARARARAAGTPKA